MAFATANPKSASFGSFLGLVGDWSGSQGDASGSVTLKGGRVYLCEFMNQDANSQEDRPTPCDISVSSGTITITVHNHADVTNGRFCILYG